MGESKSPIMGSPRKWSRHGESGLWVSDWFPHVAQHADDLAVVRSCVSDGINHAGGVCSMNTGSVFGGRPSLGAWVNYGLGSLNENLPGFVVIKDSEGTVVNGVRNWGSGFMPAARANRSSLARPNFACCATSWNARAGSIRAPS